MKLLQIFIVPLEKVFYVVIRREKTPVCIVS